VVGICQDGTNFLKFWGGKEKKPDIGGDAETFAESSRRNKHQKEREEKIKPKCGGHHGVGGPIYRSMKRKLMKKDD